MKEIDRLIRYIYDSDYPYIVDIEYGEEFGDEKNVSKLVDKLAYYGMIEKIETINRYAAPKVRGLQLLINIIELHNGSFSAYIESLTEKDDLEIEKLNYEKSIRELEQKNRELVCENLALQNWDIKFRWVIAFGTFIFGIIFKYLISILYTVLQSLTQR